MDEKKPYVPPRLTPHSSENMPKWLQKIRDDLVSHGPHQTGADHQIGERVDGEQITPARVERRAKRYGFVASVEVTDLQSNLQLQELTADLSMYGCCVTVAANKAFPSGARVHVRITYNAATFGAIGRVAYSTFDHMGIAFVRIDSDDQIILDNWIYELKEVNA